MRSCLYTSGLLLALALAASAQGLGERCRKPSNRPGTCISIRECPILLALLNRPNPNLGILHEASCGFSGRVPLVCCPDPVVPKPPTSPRPNPNPIADPTTPVIDVSNHRNLHLLPMDTCGPVADSRIIGGNETAILEFPWMALIGYDIRGEIQYHCGGSLINEKYVLTAAHCLTSLPSYYNLKTVRLGEHNLNEAVDCDIVCGPNGCDPVNKTCAPPPLDFFIEEAIPHQQYSKKLLKNDIALIRLAGRVNFKISPVRAICLPVGHQHQTRNHDKEILIVAGWGVTEKGVASPVQLKVYVPVVPLEKCKSIYERIAQIGPTQMCAGGEKGRDSCMGDSGGPLFFYGIIGEEQRTMEFGVVSFGPKSCGSEGMPGVYSRVGYYMDWILNTMKP